MTFGNRTHDTPSPRPVSAEEAAIGELLWADLAAPRGPLGPISRDQARRVASRLAGLSPQTRRAALAWRQASVGPARFSEEARAIVLGAGELDRVRGEAVGDSFYDAVLARSGASDPDSRYRRTVSRVEPGPNPASIGTVPTPPPSPFSSDPLSS